MAGKLFRSPVVLVVVGVAVTALIAGVVAFAGGSSGDHPSARPAITMSASPEIVEETPPAAETLAPPPGSVDTDPAQKEPVTIGDLPAITGEPAAPDAVASPGAPAATRTAAGRPAPATTTPVAPAPPPAAPATTTKTATTQPTAAAKAVTYSAVAGLGCTGAGAIYSAYGWFKNGNAGWWTLAQGSTREGGCNGKFDDMPMSGSAGADTTGQALVWGFHIGSAPQVCSLWIYVPTSPSKRDVIASPVRLVVMTSTKIDSTPYPGAAGERTVSQAAANHSRWVPIGNYRVTNTTIGVKLTNRGHAGAYPVTYPHIAGGAVRARCTAA
ncbi:hypothetical protein [Paractinoplanes atraurantiacus]|uniref:hypothetical protein n=1 Tax=Paractinoplanes atraurantiacus TaxID=1036182 RepID=UPI001177B298|nr:hypothetical protein [Actinoplanes atraurantiacus]